ncbi:hypothetical protein EXIGLDRAFT_835774 [Exidia glandulosa HHB12029]|uniref:Transcription factor TFIIIC triple barrel domain-containing protein n=1 Tax=Exidia glandulosa HHB12029 TaxID=1314781 RepID=A0A166AM94_EXIGL|nr:hypothetical protein EXIGLDRAFT_835774 [Exidia glandulosa HHB12029]
MSLGLIPGYEHVEQFDNDDEYESGEEVEYVTLDLGNVEPTLVAQTSTYRLAGLDTPTPFLQLSGSTFKGEHTKLLGSEILFANGRDDANPAHRFVVPHGVTSSRIRFSEVQVRPLQDPSVPIDSHDGTTTTDPAFLSAAQKQRMRRQERATKIFERPEDQKGPGRRVGWRKNKKKKDEEEEENVEEEQGDEDGEYSEEALDIEGDDDRMQVDATRPPVAGPSNSRRSDDSE